ncbi:putative F-box protein At4g09190 [Silene latifolia]|uniref:putative F-box protein At4g09190 n=1 Tax=Silene latifolia TaxID=37657 RepID=UPI003D77F68D
MKKAKSSSPISKHMIHVPEFKYIPPEIWTRILANLPVKTLLTFRCVCKSWRSTIDHPDFISMHLKHSCINSGNPKLLLALEGLGCYGEYGGYSLTVRQANTLQKTARIFKMEDLFKFYILGSCNGLLLVRQSGFRFYSEELRVSNPCIRKSLRVPKCPLPLSLMDDVVYVFGYAPVCQDYKVIDIASDHKAQKNIYVAVYTLGNQQWIVRNNGQSFDNSEFRSMSYEISEYKVISISVFFQGAIYWIGNAPSEGINREEEPTHLVSFDFDSEKFTYLELPKPVLKRRSLKFVFILRESVAIFSISNVSISIWVVENGAWAQRFKGESSWDGYDVFFDCKLAKCKIFYCESDGGCFICGKYTYNIASRQVEEVGKSMSKYLYLETYLDSLVCSKEYGQWLNSLVGGGVWMFS